MAPYIICCHHKLSLSEVYQCAVTRAISLCRVFYKYSKQSSSASYSCRAMSNLWRWRWSPIALLLLLINIADLDRRHAVRSEIIKDSGSFATYLCDNDGADESVEMRTCDVSLSRPMLRNRSIVIRSQHPQLDHLRCNHCQIGRLHQLTGLRFSLNVDNVDLTLSGIRRIAAGSIAGTFNRLALTFNELVELDEAKIFAQVPTLEQLYLDHNQLLFMDDRSLDGIPKLSRLQLNHNQLEEVRPRLFAHLPNLDILWLDNNHLQSLDSEMFSANGQLSEITLFDNALAVIADDVWSRLSRIEMLDLDALRQQIKLNTPTATSEEAVIVSRSDCDIGIIRNDIHVDQLFNHSCGNILEVPTAYLQRSQYKHINLRHNSVSSINEHTFTNISSIILTIDLSHNRLTHVHPNSFASLIYLETLLLSDNNIQNLAGATFSNLPHLLVIELQNNAIHTISTSLFWHNMRLVRLRLDHNRIQIVGDHAFDMLQQLQLLDLSDNAIQNQVLLSLNAEQVVVRQANISFLMLGDRVAHVDASQNRIGSLNLEHASSLRELNVSGNALATIDVSRAKSLQMLDVSDNQLGFVSFLANVNLVDVIATGNFINEVRFALATHLQRVDVSDNNLTSLILSGQTTFNLVHLNVSNNQLATLDAVGLLHALRELDASGNPFNTLRVTTFQNLELLERLLLRRTALTEISIGLFEHQGSSLEYLDLSHNALQTVDRAVFMGLHQLRVLLLDANNLTTLDWRLIELLPRLDRVGVSGNEWRCDELGVFVRAMVDNFVDVPSDRVGVRGASVHGIRCEVDAFDEGRAIAIEVDQLANGSQRCSCSFYIIICMCVSIIVSVN